MMRKLPCQHIHQQNSAWANDTSWRLNCPLCQRNVSRDTRNAPMPVHTARSVGLGSWYLYLPEIPSRASLKVASVRFRR
jgi:endogenous inhibitor of DNA gyrase (YacG/DUF329 family)